MSVTEWILDQVCKTSSARPIPVVCADCHKFMHMAGYDAPTPGISHSMHYECMVARYGKEAADAAYAKEA